MRKNPPLPLELTHLYEAAQVRVPTPTQAGALLHLEAVPGDAAWSETRVVKTLWPPQAGTRALRKRFGGELVCVRYRQDPEGKHRYTTVELIVDHAPVRYHPSGVARHLLSAPFWDQHLRNQLMAHGAKWNHEEQAWQMTRATATKLGVLRKTRRMKKEPCLPIPTPDPHGHSKT